MCILGFSIRGGWYFSFNSTNQQINNSTNTIVSKKITQIVGVFYYLSY